MQLVITAGHTCRVITLLDWRARIGALPTCMSRRSGSSGPVA